MSEVTFPDPAIRTWLVTLSPHRTPEEVRGYVLEITGGALIFQTHWDPHQVLAYGPGHWVEVSGGQTDA